MDWDKFKTFSITGRDLVALYALHHHSLFNKIWSPGSRRKHKGDYVYYKQMAGYFFIFHDILIYEITQLVFAFYFTSADSCAGKSLLQCENFYSGQKPSVCGSNSHQRQMDRCRGEL